MPTLQKTKKFLLQKMKPAINSEVLEEMSLIGSLHLKDNKVPTKHIQQSCSSSNTKGTAFRKQATNVSSNKMSNVEDNNKSPPRKPRQIFPYRK